MRIAMIGQKRTASREGGIEVVVGELARRMAAAGHDVTCYDRAGAGFPSEPYERDGYRVVPVRTIDRSGLAALSSSVTATREAVRSHPDIVHYHAEGPCVPLPMARRAGIRTVVTIHGLDWQRAKWGGLASHYIKHGEATAARHADELIVLSRSVQDYFRTAYGRATTLIPNGIERREGLPARAITERWGLEENGYILYLGRIVPEKCAHRLVEAFRGIPGDKRLVIAGELSPSNGYHERLQGLARADRRIMFIGHVSGDVLAELYSNAYAYVLPSDVEGMPMSLLEAMSYGCPCITSDIPECAGVLSGCGLTFSAGDFVSLRTALASVMRNPAFAGEMGRAARKRVLDVFDWDSVVDQTLALYEGRR